MRLLCFLPFRSVFLYGMALSFVMVYDQSSLHASSIMHASKTYKKSEQSTFIDFFKEKSIKREAVIHHDEVMLTRDHLAFCRTESGLSIYGNEQLALTYERTGFNKAGCFVFNKTGNCCAYYGEERETSRHGIIVLRRKKKKWCREASIDCLRQSVGGLTFTSQGDLMVYFQKGVYSKYSSLSLQLYSKKEMFKKGGKEKRCSVFETCSNNYQVIHDIKEKKVLLSCEGSIYIWSPSLREEPDFFTFIEEPWAWNKQYTFSSKATYVVKNTRFFIDDDLLPPFFPMDHFYGGIYKDAKNNLLSAFSAYCRVRFIFSDGWENRFLLLLEEKNTTMSLALFSLQSKIEVAPRLQLPCLFSDFCLRQEPYPYKSMFVIGGVQHQRNFFLWTQEQGWKGILKEQPRSQLIHQLISQEYTPYWLQELSRIIESFLPQETFFAQPKIKIKVKLNKKKNRLGPLLQLKKLAH